MSLLQCITLVQSLSRAKIPLRMHKLQNCQIQSCYPGYKVYDECKCTPVSLRKCRKGCPPGQTIRPGKCECVPKRSCQIRTCISGYYINQHECKCVNGSGSPPADSPPSSNQCQISSCDHRYKLNSKKCRCEVKRGATCRIGCPRGMRVYPGKCKCVWPPKCPITSCSHGFRICEKSCKCVKSDGGKPGHFNPRPHPNPHPEPCFEPSPKPYPIWFPKNYKHTYNPYRLYDRYMDKDVSPELKWAHRQIRPYTRRGRGRRRKVYLGSSK